VRTRAEDPQRVLARNLFVLVLSSGLGFLGFTLSMAFLPLYIEQLGVKDTAQIAIWTGLCFGVTPLVAALISPFWARLAVKYGNKIMVERALGSFVVIMAVTAMIHDVKMLFLLRLLQGILGGYAGMVLSMVASSSPKSDVGRHIGTLQSVQTFCAAVGPLVGGVISAAIGLRNTFYVTSVIYFFALVYTHYGYHNVVGEREGASIGREVAARVRDVLRLPGLLPVFSVVFIVQYIDRSFGPVIPLYVAETHGFGKSAALISGVILTAGSLAMSLAAIWWGRRSGRSHALALMVETTIAGLTCSFAMALVHSIWPIGLLRVVLGLTAGGTITLAYGWGGALIPERVRTSSFTVLSSASLYAISISPLLSGLLMTFGIKTVFALNGILYGSLLGFLLVLRKRSADAARLPPDSIPGNL